MMRSTVTGVVLLFGACASQPTVDASGPNASNFSETVSSASSQPSDAGAVASNHRKSSDEGSENVDSESDIWLDYLAWKQARRSRQLAENKVRTAELNQTDFRPIEARDHARSRVVVFRVGTCAGVKAVSEQLVPLVEEHGIAEWFVTSDWADDQELMSPLPNWIGLPTLLVLEHGKIVDLLTMAYDPEGKGLRQFLARNDLLDGPRYAVDYTKTNDLRRARSGRQHNGANFEGMRLGAVDFQHGAVTGANLRDVSLRGADLRGTNFARSDLTDADLTGAKVEGAIWLGATCPDGTLADDNPQRSCADHL